MTGGYLRHALAAALHVAILDNQNAVAWIRKRRPKNLYAAQFIQSISRLEHASKNELTAVWVASGNKTVPDGGNRLVKLDQQENVVGHDDLVEYRSPRSEPQDDANTVPPATS